jgi:hypothetical protein
MLVEQTIALIAMNLSGACLELLGADFDWHYRVWAEVVIPRRIMRAACERRDYDDSVTVLGVHQRASQGSPGLGASRGQQHHRHPLHLPADDTAIAAEFFDHALVEVIKFRHFDPPESWWISTKRIATTASIS